MLQMTAPIVGKVRILTSVNVQRLPPGFTFQGEMNDRGSGVNVFMKVGGDLRWTLVNLSNPEDHWTDTGSLEFFNYKKVDVRASVHVQE